MAAGTQAGWQQELGVATGTQACRQQARRSSAWQQELGLATGTQQEPRRRMSNSALIALFMHHAILAMASLHAHACMRRRGNY